MCAVELVTCLRGCKLEPHFKDSLYCYLSFFIELTLTNIAIHNPPKVLTHLQSPERPPLTPTTTQRQIGPNHHFHLGIISADDTSAPHYVKPPKVFQPSQQNLTMEGHHTYHYLFYQILSRWIWNNLNQEVHLRHLSHIL